MIQAISFRGDRSPVPPRVKIGFESDNLVESLAFELPELASDQSAMLMISSNAYANMIDLYRTEDSKWAVDLTDEMVGPAGVYESYVAITCPDGRRWNSGVFDLLTGDLPDISGSVETLYPTAVDRVLQEMAETRQEMAASVTASEDAAQRAEDAAQRAEDAANQGGGSTAPAKDAVLYTAQELTDEQKAQARANIGAQPVGEYIASETDPTVPDWAKQPEKPKYTPEEVGAASVETVRQLSEEKADRSEIPEPYVLPVASADTLGGVKVGNRLRMDGDVLGIEPESEYELIKTITLEEEAVVSVTDLGLHNASIYFTIPATDKTGNVALTMTIGNKKFAHIGYLLAPFSTTMKSKGRIDVIRSSGGWRVYSPASFIRSTGATAGINEVQYYPELRDIQTYDMFNGFTTSAALPKDTFIEIRGVRANA